MILSLIAAVDEAWGIGRGGRLPWHLGDDLKNFKKITWGHHLIMGRKTYESIGQPLPGRSCIVVSRQPNYSLAGCHTAGSLEAAVKIAEQAWEDEVFIIGGGQIFGQALPMADRIYLTRVHTRLECDVSFPEMDFSQWITKEEHFHAADERNQYAFTFSVLERKAKRKADSDL